MNDVVCSYLNKVFDYEEKGLADEAICLMDKLIGSFSQDAAELLLEGAKLKYRNEYYKDALLSFIEAYNQTEDREIYELVLEAYYQCNAGNFRETYRENRTAFVHYKHYYSEMGWEDECVILPLWQDEEIIVWANNAKHTFKIWEQEFFSKIEVENTVVALINEVWYENMVWALNHARLTQKQITEKLPVYFIYDEEYWNLILQMVNFQEFIKSARAVFLIGERAVAGYFKQGMNLVPEKILYRQSGVKYYTLIQKITEERGINLKKIQEQNADYYKENASNILADIKGKKIRILFCTSRFTTVLQYHTRACMRAAARLGHETRFLIEDDDISRVTNEEVCRQIAEFKPHIVFVLDTFRFQTNMGWNGMVCVSWLQDPMPVIMDKKTPDKLLARDIVISHFTTWRIFKEIGYQDVIDAPIPADSHVYQPYQLTEEEANKYQCDICFVCHASNVEEYIDLISSRVPPEWKERIYVLCKGYQNYVYQEGIPFYSLEEFMAFVDGVLKEKYQITANKGIISHIANDMYTLINQRIYRQCLVDWLLDAGYTNIKLWGNGWVNTPKYAEYAMGAAENGETLSKIYQASKIVLGNNIMTTAAARAWEAMLSGAFYMSNYIPPNEDVTDIRKIIKEQEEVVMFYDREDMLTKVGYYLQHEDERRKMAEIGRNAALERMTFDRLMDRVLKEIPKIIERREREETTEKYG